MSDNPLTLIQETISSIRPLDSEAMAAAQARQNSLTKPAGSLGRLESLSVQLAGIFRNPLPEINQKAVITMAGDHGVVASGVSAFPQEVTPQMVFNFLNGGAAINVLARHIGARISVVDMGVAYDFEPHPNLRIEKIAPGTQNIFSGPAMSAGQAAAAVAAGIRVVSAEIDAGLDIVGTGDMGIGNTTPSATVAAAFTGEDPASIVGRGTGVDDAGLQRKIEVVRTALQVNQPDPEDGLDVLARVGGFEIGGLAGVILGAAARGKAVMIDGFISTAAAMIAAALAPQVRDYLIAAHHSQEFGHSLMLEWLGLEPLVNLDFRLGEGTGAAIGISLAEAACKVLSEMATFAEAGVSDKEE